MVNFFYPFFAPHNYNYNCERGNCVYGKQGFTSRAVNGLIGRLELKILDVKVS